MEIDFREQDRSFTDGLIAKTLDKFNTREQSDDGAVYSFYHATAEVIAEVEMPVDELALRLIHEAGIQAAEADDISMESMLEQETWTEFFKDLAQGVLLAELRRTNPEIETMMSEKTAKFPENDPTSSV